MVLPRRDGAEAKSGEGPGYLAVAGAAVLWAMGGTVASYLIDEGASFVELTEARAWITAAVLAVVVRLGPPGAEPAPRWNVLTVVFGLSIAMANLTYYAALSRLNVAVAIIVQYTAPGLVVCWVAISRRRRPSRGVTLALVAALGGVVLLAELPALVTSGELRLDGLGLVVAAMSAVAFATYIVTSEHMGRGLGAKRAVFRGFCVASVVWVVVQAFRGTPETLTDARFLPGVLFLAVGTTIAPFLAFVWGVRRVSASEAGIVSTLEPLAATLIAFVWLGQSLSPLQVAGGVLVVAGIGIVQWARPASRALPPAPAAVP